LVGQGSIAGLAVENEGFSGGWGEDYATAEASTEFEMAIKARSEERKTSETNEDAAESNGDLYRRECAAS